MPAASKNDRPQGQDAYLRIVADIRAGSLRPGDRITETDLATRLGISRTPVREAMRQLETDGLVVHQPRMGTTIRALDTAEVSELYEMRTVLEGTAASLAARAASDVELDDIAAIQDAMKATSDIARLYDLNRQFHTAILNAARNRFLTQAMEAVQKTLLILGPSTLQADDRAAAALDEHDALLDALRSRDCAAAETIMRRHLRAAHRARLQQQRAQTQSLDIAHDL